MSEKPPIKTWLAARTAEMLALPHMACRRRDCRRRNTCYWHFKSNKEPCCLRNLTAEQRKLFDVVYEEARFAEGFFGSDSHLFDARDGGRRMLADMAIEIARTSPHRWRPEIWDAARRRRAKTLPPAEGG
ncbi:hypothetical protein [Rhizobium sp. YS-1r]|uniref:hypothetical protein n=1 Tax=Rhizobium sp. YS-1r TaxID=1532558 RepID=UPI00050FA69A|nr:hypothetical protein [Rhizobium sp. YS-1r]KGD94431.1 hypothetical protein JL39_21450 [Rhizobium sp. YS-1r]